MTPKRKRLITNIIFYVVIVLVYGFAITMVITKINGGVIYLFNIRYDVILTDSMSEREPSHLDFLEGTTQIQPFDLVISKKVNQADELNIKDIVLFKSPDLNNNTVCHRIVDKKEFGDELFVYSGNSVDYKGYKTVKFDDYYGSIKIDKLDINGVQIEFLSPNEYDNNFIVQFGGTVYSTTYESELINDYYRHIVNCTRESSYPILLSIFNSDHKETYFRKLELTRANGNKIVFEAQDFVQNEDKIFKKMYNSYYLYEIRGDKAKDSDKNTEYNGLFGTDKIVSRVTVIIPKLGYAVRFLSSIPGILLFVGLGLLITYSSFIYNKKFKNTGQKKEEQNNE